MMRTQTAVCILVAILGTGMPGAWAQHSDHTQRGTPPEKLGQVSFSVTCNAAAQKEFNWAMALFHSFWFDPAIQSFKKVLEHDPECGMAHWGIALMSLGNPFAWPPGPTALEAAEKAIDDAGRVAVKSERERGYTKALNTFLKDWETAEHRQRALAYEKAMEKLAARHPDDIEAQILYALALNITASPTDKTFANQLKAASILEPLLEKYPQHPGVAHYLIHTYDYSELAEEGLKAARKYTEIAPSVPHALHMPSHIFARIGLWEEMVESNRASYHAARSELEGTELGVGNYDALHALDYMVFGYLQLAQDQAAQEYVNRAAAVNKVNVENFPAAYALAAIPARFAVERGDWEQAAALELSPTVNWGRFPHAEAVLVFARSLGRARSDDIGAARQDLERLQALKKAMATAGIDYWVEQAEFQIKGVQAWIALAEARHDEAIKQMRAAAAAEDASDKHPVTPGNVAPSRELLGEMLLALDRPAQALREFEQSMERDPNRFRSVYGAARAAEASGNDQAARNHYTKLQSLTADHDTERPELTQARMFLARQ